MILFNNQGKSSVWFTICEANGGRNASRFSKIPIMLKTPVRSASSSSSLSRERLGTSRSRRELSS